MIRPPPRSTLFPSTPLSRSHLRRPHRRAVTDGQPRWHFRRTPVTIESPADELSSPLPAPEFAAATTAVVHNIERSEEHTSELQSPCNLVCRLLLEKKNTNAS